MIMRYLHKRTYLYLYSALCYKTLKELYVSPRACHGASTPAAKRYVTMLSQQSCIYVGGKKKSSIELFIALNKTSEVLKYLWKSRAKISLLKYSPSEYLLRR